MENSLEKLKYACFLLQMDDIIALIRWMGVAKKRLKIVQVKTVSKNLSREVALNGNGNVPIRKWSSFMLPSFTIF